jgi:hypothetical protein
MRTGLGVKSTLGAFTDPIANELETAQLYPHHAEVDLSEPTRLENAVLMLRQFGLGDIIEAQAAPENMTIG